MVSSLFESGTVAKPLVKNWFSRLQESYQSRRRAEPLIHQTRTETYLPVTLRTQFRGIHVVSEVGEDQFCRARSDAIK
jgi:hypothetical protein